MNVSLHIVYEGSTDRPLTAVRTKNRELIRQVAETTVQEAFERAQLSGESDVFVGAIQKEEAERLQRVLKAMIPELKELDS
jgi:hypothetical protein